MAVIRQGASTYVSLAPRTLVGRHPDCTLVLASPTVGRHHAVFRFDAVQQQWTVKDLASRNGVFVDGARLSLQPHPLASGAMVRFGGDDEAWEVLSVAAPGPAAVERRSGTLVEGAGGTLELPGASAPIVHTPDGWMLDHGDRIEWILEQHELELGGQTWRVLLPQSTPADTAATSPAPAPDVLHLDFVADPVQDVVASVRVSYGSRDAELGVTKPLRLLWVLAKARLQDRESEEPEPEQGWLTTSALCAEVQIAPHLLATYVFRVRRQLDETGLCDGQAMIEARAGNERELRLADCLVTIAFRGDGARRPS